MSHLPVTNGVTTVLPPPEGYMVDFDNPQKQYHDRIYWNFGVGGVLALMLIVQRLYTNTVLTKGLHSDDGEELLNLYEVSLNAVGVHAWEMSIQKYETYMMCSLISTISHVLCGGCAKLSLLLFYLRLSPQKWFRIPVYVTMGIVVGYTIGFFFAVIFVCDPPQKAWDVHVVGGHCNTNQNMAIAIINAITDLMLFILPIPMVVKLQLPLGQKIGILFVFTVAAATLVTSAIRCFVLVGFFSNRDKPWVSAPVSMWIGIEANLFVICAALPTLRKFSSHVMPNVFGLAREPSRSDKAAQSTGFGYPRSHRNNYAKFGEESELDIIPPQAPKTERQVTVEANTENRGWDTEDGNQAIVQTTTFTIEYAQGYLYKI
ncbi:hypothetical protein F4779DRAFT_631490 [Xylariaceae sp. FL0662B]|nr:hypothetical protein F4779DRAFT_631490 [Xylariaceae sp. FL0662B]